MQMGRDLLKERNVMVKGGTPVDTIESELKRRFSDFALEFPTVFGSIVH